MRRKSVIAGLVGLMLMAMLAGCRPAGWDIETSPYAPGAIQPGDTQPGNTTQPTENQEPVNTTAPTQETEPTTEVTEPTLPVPTDPNSVAVSTPYGYLQYQDQWVEFMQVDQQQDGDILTVRFCAVINEKEYPLFTLTIGAQTDYPTGQITDAWGTVRNVLVQVHEIEMDPSLTDGEQNRLFAMQEEINYVLEKLN